MCTTHPRVASEAGHNCGHDFSPGPTRAGILFARQRRSKLQPACPATDHTLTPGCSKLALFCVDARTADLPAGNGRSCVQGEPPLSHTSRNTLHTSGLLESPASLPCEPPWPPVMSPLFPIVFMWMLAFGAENNSREPVFKLTWPPLPLSVLN
jgi:hypothetical protein